MPHDRIVNQHQPGLALYPRNLSYDLLPLVGPSGWSLLRALHDHSDEQALNYRGTRPIAPSSEEMQALAGVGEASLLVIKELLHLCGCLSWEEIRGKQEPRPGRQLKQPPTRSLVYYLHPLTGLVITTSLVQRVIRYAQRSERAQAYLKANGLFRAEPAFLPTSVWPSLLPQLLELPDWQDLFQQIHGPTKHRQYRQAVARWLNVAAQTVATLELEQQGVRTPEASHVANHAVMVMARWQPSDTMPSWGVHGALVETHDESPLRPHTPVNELINQSTNEQTDSGRLTAIAGGPEGKAKRGDRSGQQGMRQAGSGELRRTNRADAGMQLGLQADAVAQALDVAPLLLVQHSTTQASGPPEAGHFTSTQAEAALWAVLPDILQPRAAGSTPGLAAALPYSPTASERRQARRLLRQYPHTVIINALRQAVSGYQPGPGQPPTVTRFGFAAGLPIFQVALAQPVEDATAHDRRASSSSKTMADFWHEYERVTGHRPTRAERTRLEVVAIEVEEHHLLIWLDRWERAHRGTTTTLTPGYFEACAAGTALPRALAPAHPAGVGIVPPSPPAPSSSLSLAQHEVYERLVGLGIKKAHDLALLPSTTRELVEAWSLASTAASVKNRCAFIASGIVSGQPPRERPSLRADNTHAAISHEAPPSIMASQLSQLWTAFLTRLKAEMSSNDFETWLRPCSLVEIGESTVVIAAPNIFARQELEQRYRVVVQRIAADITGRQLEPLFVIASYVH